MRGEQEGYNMSVVLSASVRQNLLSLQSTADLLSTTQNRLASGKKVNTALDNPTNFFTAAGLDSRASDINNLLDGIGNGVQILQAANTGITSLQKLVDTAKSLANQALQTPVGYSTKSNVSTTIAGATPDDLRGTQTFASATATSNAVYNGTAGGTTPVTGTTTLGGVAASLIGTAAPDGAGTAASLSGTLKLIGTPAGAATIGATAQPNDGDTMMVNGKTITFRTGPAPTAATAPVGLGVDSVNTNVVTDGNGNSTVYLGTAGAPTGSVADLTKAIDLASGVQKAVISNGVATASASSGTVASIAAGVLTLSTSTGSDLNISGKADLLKQLGLTTSVGAGTVSVSQSRTTAPGTIGNLIQSGSTLYVNGKTITFKDASVPAAANIPAGSGSPVGSNLVTDGSGNTTVYLQGGKISDVLTAIDLATGVQTAVNNAATGVAALTTTQGSTASTVAANGTFKISTGTIQDLSISGSGNALSALGLAGNTGTSTVFTAARAAGPGGISGTTLTFSSFKGGTPVNITFGDGSNGTVKTLAQLNVALAANNLAATVDATGKLVIAAGNDYASSTMGSVLDGGTMGGTVTSALSFTSAAPPLVDLPSQSTRANLVAQYNNLITQITTTSQDASFNGVNLLAGDTLKLVFNETGKSTLNITGSELTPAGLGLPTLISGSDFIDNASTNQTLSQLNMASTQLRSLASALGSNLSIVQIRQDFAKNLINVLQTGSSNLTLADTNEEAANSQALSTRQSIAVSALALANQSQQSVLKLLQ
jgi:flagellin-like hook-associated protein FlgL